MTKKSIMTRGARGPMQKAGRSVEYVVWSVIRLNNTATPVCIEIHLDRTLTHTTSIIQKIKQLNVRNIIIVKHAHSRWII